MVVEYRNKGWRQATALTGLYCVVFMLQRLVASPTLHRDEAEQFLFASQYALTTGWQPPLYSWLVRTLAFPLGLNLSSILLTKYLLIFVFYLTFYALCRRVWEHRESLIVTGSLMLIPVYCYEFNRDLSHTVLVSVMAAATLLVATRLLERRRTCGYALLGVLVGLGMLSKYNYMFIASAMVLAALTTAEGRKALCDWRILISVLLAVVIVLPHFAVILQNRLFTVSRALQKSHAYDATIGDTVKEVLAAYTAALVFGGAFWLFFGPVRTTSESGRGPAGQFFRRTAVFAMAMPMLTAVILQAGQFRGRWLAPVLFTLPLGLFTLVELPQHPKRANRFALLCLAICVGVFGVRSVAIWLPHAAGPDEIHVPFDKVASQLENSLHQAGIVNLGEIAVVSESNFLRANLLAHLPFRRYRTVRPTSEWDEDLISDVRRTGAVLVWDAEKQSDGLPEHYRAAFPDAVLMETISTEYLRNRGGPRFQLGAALVSGLGP